MKKRFLKRSLLVVLLILCTLLFSAYAIAFDFTGTTYDATGNILPNVTVNITIWQMVGGPPTLVNVTSNISDANGNFSITLAEDVTYMYQGAFRLDNNTALYVAKPLPMLPYGEFSSLGNVKFYLKEGIKVSVTVNATAGTLVNFSYQVKDEALGYSVLGIIPRSLLR